MTEHFEIRPWGRFDVLSDAHDCKVKRITVAPGRRLSLQVHARRDEHWLVITGQPEVTVGETTVTLEPGDAVDIVRNTAHRLANPGTDPVVIIEVQTGDYFGEDDIVRLEDDFARVR